VAARRASWQVCFIRAGSNELTRNRGARILTCWLPLWQRTGCVRRQRHSSVMARRFYRIATRCARQVVACLLIVSLSGGIAGIPVVEFGPKDHSRPFPCQDNPCGCSSAEACWHHCCCHTNREKVAWAEAHGVTPPSYVVEAAEKEGESTEQVCEHHAGCPSCAAKLSNATKASQPAACATRSCCSHKHEASPAQPTRQAVAQKKQLRVGLVLSDLARRCRGLPQLWTLLSQVLPTRVEAAWSLDLTIVCNVEELSLRRPRVVFCPPVPPPEPLASCG
jgi:hypothetical protein